MRIVLRDWNFHHPTFEYAGDMDEYSIKPDVYFLSSKGITVSYNRYISDYSMKEHVTRVSGQLASRWGMVSLNLRVILCPHLLPHIASSSTSTRKNLTMKRIRLQIR
jgi:hypothetical protein